jgi:cell division control protein 6
MGRFFKDRLMEDESLFKDERVFDFDYIPRDFNFRDSQLRELELCLKPALRGGRAMNTRITGAPATGKTTAVKLMFSKVAEVTSRVVCVHVNCQIHTSKFSIFSQIHKKVVGHLPPETGVPFPRVYEAIFRNLEKDGRSLVVALDDMNYLFYDRHANEIIYDLLRAHEVYPGSKTAVFGIVSDVGFTYKLDLKVSSIYRPYEIFFQPYKAGEILEILRSRIKEGFNPGVVSEGVVEMISDHAFTHGDLRMGIELLRKSAINAELDGSRRITQRHVEKAFESSRLVTLRELLAALSEEERLLVSLIAENEEIASGKLYQDYKSRTGQSYTKFYRALDKLESLRLIDTRFKGKGRKGRTRDILSRYCSDEISGALGK